MKPKRLSEKTVFDHGVFRIKEVEFSFPDGKKARYQILDKGDSAMVVPLKGANVVLVREFFYAIDEYQLGLPKGRIDDGHSAEQTANKELQEEIGYKAGELTQLGVLTLSPGYSTQRTHIFLARGLVPSKLEGDEMHPLEVVEHPFADFESLIESGKVTDARMIAALYMARKFVGDE